MAFPEIAGTLAVPVGRLPAVGMAGNGNAPLALHLLNNTFHGIVRIHEPFHIHCQNVIAAGLVGDFGPRDQQHAVFVPGPAGFAPEALQVAVEVMAGDGPGLGIQLPEFRVNHMVGDANGIKTAVPVQVHHRLQGFQPIAPLGVDMKIAQDPPGSGAPGQ